MWIYHQNYLHRPSITEFINCFYVSFNLERTRTPRWLIQQFHWGLHCIPCHSMLPLPASVWRFAIDFDFLGEAQTNVRPVLSGKAIFDGSKTKRFPKWWLIHVGTSWHHSETWLNDSYWIFILNTLRMILDFVASKKNGSDQNFRVSSLS